MSKLYGYAGRVLHIDVGVKTFKVEDLDERTVRDYIGGRGLAASILFREVKPGTDPLGPDNRLILVNGPLADTPAQSFTRWIATTKSPLTGTYMRSSGGGRLAQAMKRAGYDAVVIKGKAARPLCLHVTPEGVSFLDGSRLWGMETGPVQDAARKLVGDPNAVVACVGPAAEVGVLFASIFSDARAAARGGVGTVMGAKGVKAIAFSGAKTSEAADPKRFRELVRTQVAAFRDTPGRKSFSKYGTTDAAQYFNSIGIFPSRNFRKGVQEGMKALSGDEYVSMLVRDTGCPGCIVQCGKLLKVPSGPYKGAQAEGPEYETIWSFSGTIDYTDKGLTVAANQLCDELGLDTISTGNAIGYLTELAERGLVSAKELGSLKLGWGRPDSVLDLIRLIARREGIGDLLAQGVRAVAARLGAEAESFAIHAKGLEFPAYEPRACKAQGLNFATSNVGANHCMGYSSQEIYGRKLPFETDALSLDRKGYVCKFNQDETAFMETGIVCTFYVSQGWVTADILAGLLEAYTGISEFKDPAYLWKVGERIYNLERLFNVREGFGRKDDTLPARIISEPLQGGPGDGQIFELEQLLDQYYHERGWNLKTGNPEPETLRRLGLEGV